MKELTQILAALAAAPSDDVRKWALATLVTVEGSSYRRAGARMLWRGENLPPIGGISGGCLEDDLKIHCADVVKTGAAKTIIYDTTSENDLVWGVGTGCHGIVRVVVEPARQAVPALSYVPNAWPRREPVTVATIFRFHRANAAQKLGTTLGWSDDLPVQRGNTARIITKPTCWQPMPRAAIERATRACLRARKSTTRIFRNLPGSPEIFFDYLPPPPTLAIFGAGDDAQPLARMAAELGWQVHVTDPRPAYATRERFPEAVAVGSDAPPLDEYTLAVVMTHHYIHDVPALRDLLPRKLAYLGLLGSKKRAEKILADLERDGLQITPDMRARFHAPVGLDIGADTPETIALSILAEMQSVLGRREAKPLRDRAKAIHDA